MNGTDHTDGDRGLLRMAFLGELLAETSHEVNNWLQIIMGFAQARLAGSSARSSEGMLTSINDAAMRAGRLAGAILQFARGSEGEGPGDVTAAVTSVALLFGHRFGPLKGRTLSVETSGPIPPVAISSADLELVLANVVKNALDATEGVPDAQVHIRSRVRADRVVLEAWNSGPPIECRMLPRIFEKYFTTKPPGKGTGLGLWTCRRLASVAGGSIQAENVLEGGVLVSIDLPTAAAAAAAECPRERPVFSLQSLSGRRLLLVDDDAAVRETLRLMFTEASGALVEQCACGEDALRILQDHAFDAVVLDLRMPGMSGEEVYRRLPADVRARVVFITGDTASRSTREFLTATRQPTLLKPVGLREVLDAVLSVARN